MIGDSWIITLCGSGDIGSVVGELGESRISVNLILAHVLAFIPPS